MPMYTFKCEKCDKKLEVIQSFKDSNPVCDCTKKTVSMIRLMPMTARPKFSGSGFYEMSTAKDATSEGGTSFNIFQHRTGKYRVHHADQGQGWN